MRADRRLELAIGLDVFVVVLFVAIGRRTHEEGSAFTGVLKTALPFLIGLAIAIPAIAAFNILKNRIARLVLEVGITSEGLMSRFQNVGGKKA